MTKAQAQAKRDAADYLIASVVADYLIACNARFDEDGRRDGGACGGAILVLDGRTVVAKRLLATGQGVKGTDGVMVCFSHGLPTQNREVEIAGMRKVRERFEKAGVKINRFWTYVD